MIHKYVHTFLYTYTLKDLVLMVRLGYCAAGYIVDRAQQLEQDMGQNNAVRTDEGPSAVARSGPGAEG